MEMAPIESTHVLLAVGDEPFGELTRISLRNEGFEVTVADSYGSALAALDDHAVDCVVTDFEVPPGHGTDLFAAVRDRDRELPFVLFTTGLSESAATEAIQEGVSDYVEWTSKSDQRRRLADRIRELVDAHRQARLLSQLGRAMEVLTQGIALLDDGGRIVHVNEAFGSLFGVDTADAVGKPAVECLPGSVADVLESSVFPSLSESGRWVGQLNGGEPAILSATVLADGGTALTASSTEGDQATRETDALQRRFRAVFTQGFDAMLVADDEGRYVDANPAACELLGLPREEVLGRRIDEFAEETFDFEAAWTAFLEAGHQEGRFTLTRPDGERRILDFEAQADIVPGEHLSVLEDVTESVERDAALRAMTERYQALLTNLPRTAVVLVDADRRYRVVGGTVVDLLGLDPERSVGRRVGEVHEPSVRESLAPLYEVVLEGYPVSAEVGLAGRRLQLTGTPMTVEDGDGPHAVVVFVDVTEDRADERRLEEHNRRLEEFASIVSHDLRSPLATATGWVNIAIEDGTQVPMALERADAALERMDELVTGLLTLARSGQVETVSGVSLDEVVRGAWAETHPKEGATLSVVDDLGTATADPERLRELFADLFENAVRHGGPDVEVTVGPLEEGFYVADDGPGIPPEDRERVLERGVSTRPGGTGLGLYIVGQIAQAHSWSMTVGDGARFEFTGVD